MVVTKQDLQLDQIAQLLDQDLFADTSNAPPYLREARRPALNMVEDQRLPLAPDDGQRDIKTARCVHSIHDISHLPFGMFYPSGNRPSR